jgi:outer membrane protein
MSTLFDKFNTVQVKSGARILRPSGMIQHPLFKRQQENRRIMRKFLVPLISILGLLGASISLAADSDPETPTQSAWSLGVALGYGIRTNPLALSDDIPILVDLDVSWFGKRWFFDNGDLGFTVLDQDRYTASLVGRFNNDRVFFGKASNSFISISDGIQGPVIEKIKVPDRNYAVEAGVEILADGDWGYLQATAFHDVSGTHGGYELFANYSYSVRRQRWFYRPSLGVSWKSKDMNDYYWGVQESEANAIFPAYTAGAGLNVHAQFMTSYQINRHWALIAVLEYERMNSEAADSPIVEDQVVLGTFVGFKYEY